MESLRARIISKGSDGMQIIVVVDGKSQTMHVKKNSFGNYRANNGMLFDGNGIEITEEEQAKMRVSRGYAPLPLKAN